MILDNSYTVLTSPKFNKIVKKKLPRNLKKALDKKIKYLANNPHHPSLNTKAIKVSKKFCNQHEVDQVWEFYINKGFRCIFYVSHKDKEIILAMVGNHEDVLRKFPR